MLSIPSVIVQELHKLATSGTLLFLVSLPAYSMYWANSNSDIVWNGITWERLGFWVDGIGEDSNSIAPELLVNLPNIGGVVEEAVLANDNFSRAAIHLYMINTACLDETEPIYHIELQVLKPTVTRKVVVFKIGLDNPMMLSFPTWLFHGSICQYFRNGTMFKGPLCGYTGAFTACNYTLDDCLERGNTERFGAQLGLLGAIQDDDGL
jgi:phage-related protein